MCSSPMPARQFPKCGRGALWCATLNSMGKARKHRRERERREWERERVKLGMSPLDSHGLFLGDAEREEIRKRNKK